MAGKKSFALCLLSIVASMTTFGADIFALGTSGHTKELKAGKLSMKILSSNNPSHSSTLFPYHQICLKRQWIPINQQLLIALHLGLTMTMEHASVATYLKTYCNATLRKTPQPQIVTV